jgi:hypothetical protein
VIGINNKLFMLNIKNVFSIKMSREWHIDI